MVNKFIGIGRATRDAKTFYTPGNSVAVTEFGFAMSDRYKKGDESVEQTCFIDVKSFGKMGEIVEQYVKKGKLLYIEGKLAYHRWEKNGHKFQKHEVILQKIRFLEKKSQDEPDMVEEENTEDVPF
ncbi:single-stranded DNA-binding protein [Deferribacter abyssi]|uniref:single-stranded DNA-binding protein n=1 Tax=Deferribacter abyssi TaxID=213806 RepID=UPI003C1F592C